MYLLVSKFKLVFNPTHFQVINLCVKSLYRFIKSNEVLFFCFYCIHPCDNCNKMCIQVLNLAKISMLTA